MKKIYNYNVHWITKRKPFTKANGERLTVNVHDERNQTFYTSTEWLNLRNLYRLNNPLCCMCKAEGIINASDVVDHITSITDDYDKRLDYNNLQSLCHKHHFIKTKEEIKARKAEVQQRIIKETMNNLNDFN